LREASKRPAVAKEISHSALEAIKATLITYQRHTEHEHPHWVNVSFLYIKSPVFPRRDERGKEDQNARKEENQLEAIQ